MHRTIHILFCLILTVLVVSCASTPDYYDLPAEELYQQGVEKIEKEDYEGAREILEALKAQDAKKIYYPFALLRIADSYFAEQKYLEAGVEYESFLKLHPYHQSAPYAQYRLGLSAFNQIEGVDRGFSYVREARHQFIVLLERYPRNKYREPAEVKIRQCDDLLAEYEQYVGMFYFKKGSYEAAVKRFEGLLGMYPTSSIVPETLYHLGMTYQLLERDEQARVAFSRLVTEYPLSTWTADAKELLAED